MGPPRFRFFFRQKRFLIYTIFVIIVFLMYQLISVGQLGKELSRRKPRPKLQTNFKNYEKADGFMHAKHVEIEKREVEINNKIEIKPNPKFIPGVLPEDQKLYTPTDKNMFKCIRSGEEINFSWVNDDFCDCTDFSDEPSTSACNTGRFHCTLHSPHSPASVISYKVNDGICDCCDGSDEWHHVILPEHSLVPVNKQKGIFQVPCPIRC